MSYPPPPFDPNQSNSNDPTAPYHPPSPYQPPPGTQGNEPPTMPYGQPPQSVPPAPGPYDPQSAPPGPPSYQPGQATPSYGPPPGYPPAPEYGGQPGYPPPPGGYPGAPGMPGMGPPKKSKTPMIIAIVVGVALLLCLGCGGGGYYLYNQSQDIVDSLPTTAPTADLPTQKPSGDPTGPSSSGSGKVIRYEVSGSGQASITYTGGDGKVVQDDVTLPWTKEVTTQENFFLASVIVLQLGGKNNLTCTVSSDGKELRTRTSTGVVTCTGIPE